jgi:ubiquinone/menaquinone biosynthesis C-methylase UbiE
MALSEDLRRRLGGVRYAGLWMPRSEEQARRYILNDPDPEAFDRSGAEAAERLGPHLSAGAVVVDLGCGIGRVALHVAPRCRLLWAVDASPLMLRYARRRLGERDNVLYARSRGTAVPDVPTGSVDLVYSLLTLQHLEREDAFLLMQDVHRMLRPDGVAYLTFPNLLSDTYLDAFTGYARQGLSGRRARARFYTPQEVARVLPAAGLAISAMEEGTEIVVTCAPTPVGRASTPTGGDAAA